jgi:hypothetical protein
MSDTTTVFSHRRALLLIFAVWAGWLGVLALLGWLGQGTGLMVWPMGEDRNWINLLMKPSVGETARGLWQIDHRNPLSPWWYIAFKPMIMGWPQGLFMLRNLVSLALALSAYGLIVIWLGTAARAFAVTVACLIAVFTANAFFDQIYWNFQVALVCSILCVTCYLRHRREPASGQWLAAALALWLIAIATYTIQTGAIVAIAYAAWSLRERSANNSGRVQEWAMGLRDVVAATWPFAVILLLFILIWQTTSVPAETFVGAPTIGRLLESLQTGFWHPDSTLMRDVLALSAHRHVYGLAGLFAFVAAFLAARARSVEGGQLFSLLILVGCLAVPTLLVETVGTQWPPGSRWRMMYQLTTPAFYLAMLGMIAFSLPAAIGRLLWRGGVAACFGLAVLASLAHNERQVALTTSERNLRRTIIGDAVKQPGPGAGLHYLVLLDDGGRWFSQDTLSPIYAKTWFPGLAADFRLVPSTGIYAGLQQGPSVTFMDDASGVANATLDGKTIPYSQIRLVRSRGLEFVVLNRLQRSDLEGLRAEWQRTEPVLLSPCAPPTPDCR